LITIQQVDPRNKKQVNEFIQFHYDLYAKCPQWVPPFKSDVRNMLNPEKHPFYDHSQGAFFIAKENDHTVGRLVVFENIPYNTYHGKKLAGFTLFDSINNQEVANSLFEKAFEWAKEKNLDEIIGPKGFGPFDGYGMLIEGFQYRQVMNMMSYNYEYYPSLVEQAGFSKLVDFVCTRIKIEDLFLPDRVEEIATKVLEKGSFKVKRFKSKNELKSWARRIGQAYNKTFVKNWEYYPLSDHEIDYVMKDLMMILDPQLIKLIQYKEELVGFLVAFPDLSAAMQRHGGGITPWGILDLLRETKKTKRVILNGLGIVPELLGRGGNALLYSEMVKTVKDWGFDDIELTQMAETAVQVRKDMEKFGAVTIKNHRVYHKTI